VRSDQPIEQLDAVAAADVRADELREGIFLSLGEEGAPLEEVRESGIPQRSVPGRGQVVTIRCGDGREAVRDKGGVIVQQPIGIVGRLFGRVHVFLGSEQHVGRELVLETRVRPLLEFEHERGGAVRGVAAGDHHVDSLAGERKVVFERDPRTGTRRVAHGGGGIEGAAGADSDPDIEAAERAEGRGKCGERILPATQLRVVGLIAMELDELPRHVTRQGSRIRSPNELRQRSMPQVHRAHASVCVSRSINPADDGSLVGASEGSADRRAWVRTRRGLPLLRRL
jgi:hypothetical protein